MGDIRMGKGKGIVLGFIVKIKAGTVLFEINSFRKNQEKLILHLRKIIKKLPLQCKIINL
jgi:ribosomal protein L16/L10AE